VKHHWLLLLTAIGSSSCVGTTGSDLLDFNAYAAGPAGADGSAPIVFASGRGWQVTLSTAKLHIGAAHLDSAMPSSGSQGTSCILPGIYVASVPGGADINVLSGALQSFAVNGEGTATRALAGELWLTGGDVNADDDSTVILEVAGVAFKDARSIPFEGKVTIGSNRAIPPADPALPGANPMCKQRIVSPIPVDLTPSPGGALVVRINPAGWFSNVDFAALQPAANAPGTYAFADDNSDQASLNLFLGLRATQGVYSFLWARSPLQ
jgi:hypothetical protein